MLRVGRNWVVLAQLGEFLAAQDAQEIEIADEGHYLAVAWNPTGAPRVHRCFNEADLDQLREVTRKSARESRSHAVLLGLLGREIDQARVEVARISEDPDSFLVSGTSGGRYISWRCDFAQLTRAGRAAPPTRAEPVKPTPSPTGRVPGPPAPRLEAGPDAHISPLRHRLQLTR